MKGMTNMSNMNNNIRKIIVRNSVGIVARLVGAQEYKALKFFFFKQKTAYEIRLSLVGSVPASGANTARMMVG